MWPGLAPFGVSWKPGIRGKRRVINVLEFLLINTSQNAQHRNSHVLGLLRLARSQDTAPMTSLKHLSFSERFPKCTKILEETGTG